MTDTPERELIDKLRWLCAAKGRQHCGQAADKLEALLSRVDKLEERVRILVWNAAKSRGAADDVALRAVTEEIDSLNRTAS